ncbi:YceI family protein [Peredibacter starrii]|uniref:YceI family protein n=1 Tax=Peredibacter starrii TaxID=28202 RepID=A0AAX4HJT3_9BACT|nr:YceI family protein [Peredibacter starrii]WPU63490.1 YceI family protein [Peredibacter starrii]
MKQILLLAAFLSLSIQAAPWHANRDHSEVLFQVGYLGVSELTGRFTAFDADVDVEPKPLSFKSLNIKIDVNSIETGNKMRDGHLKNAEFFDARQFPSIIFKSDKIVLMKDNKYKAQGTLTIKNVSRPANVEFTVTDSVKDTWGYENKFVKFESKLNRKDFNINWNKTLDNQKYLVSDEVSYRGVFQIQPNDGKTPPSKHMIPDTEYIREREIQNRKNQEESSFSKGIRKLINGN